MIKYKDLEIVLRSSIWVNVLSYTLPLLHWERRSSSGSKANDQKHKRRPIILFLCTDLQHIEQDERVSMGLNGDLYFSHAVEKDSRRDYCCFAAFPRIRTIVQKTAMSVVVKTSRCRSSSFFVFTQRRTDRSNMRADVHIHCHASKAIQVSHCCVYVHLLGYMLWIWSRWCLSYCFHAVLMFIFFLLLFSFLCLSHPPPFQKKATRVLKLVSF